MKNLLSKKYIRLILAFALAAAIFFMGMRLEGYWMRQQNFDRSPADIKQLREAEMSGQKKYTFIDPLLGCAIVDKKESTQFSSLKSDLLEYINQKIKQGVLKTASVYFDRRDGHWLGINTGEKYFPASLMKVPTMIALYKAAESDPNLLKKRINFTGDFDLNGIEYFMSSQQIKPHHSYTVDELIDRMILYSDNNATALLLNESDQNELEEVYTDLGITIPDDASQDLADFMTVKAYANFFRVLHNATYLNREMSEKALTLLGKADFTQGMVAGLSKNVLVAHKFGERNFGLNANDATTDKELHDCGIVYFPDHPYLLCIMTKGKNFDALANVIKDMSSLVYKTTEKEFAH